MIIQNKAFAVDTNVLIYLHDISAPNKRAIANALLANIPKIPSQVVSEYLNTCRRILDLPKDRLLRQSAELLADCNIIPAVPDTLMYASELVLKYKFQLFDAVVVATCIEGKCEILYSEDMQHKLVVDKSITILNPLL